MRMSLMRSPKDERPNGATTQWPFWDIRTVDWGWRIDSGLQLYVAALQCDRDRMCAIIRVQFGKNTLDVILYRVL